MRVIQVGTIKIRIDGNNISLIQPDPITGVKNWVVITFEELKQIKTITDGIHGIIRTQD